MSKIKCEICGEGVHFIKPHLAEQHPEVSIEDYQQKFPNAPLLSEAAKVRIAEVQAKKKQDEQENDVVKQEAAMKPLHEVFNLDETTEGVMSSNGRPIPIEVLGDHPTELGRQLVPDIDKNYIFHVPYLKPVLMGLQVNIPVYLVGHAGTGKSTLLEQIGAYTRRPTFRVQHSGNTEEAHILGQYVVKEGATSGSRAPCSCA